MKKTGRPPKEIDWDEFDKLCAMQSTQEEIASWFDCDVSSIRRKCHKEKGMSFERFYEQKAKIGKISLRRVQMQSALKGNVAMQIWLGKNWLGQSDKQTITVDTEAPVRHDLYDEIMNDKTPEAKQG